MFPNSCPKGQLCVLKIIVYPSEKEWYSSPADHFHKVWTFTRATAQKQNMLDFWEAPVGFVNYISQSLSTPQAGQKLVEDTIPVSMLDASLDLIPIIWTQGGRRKKEICHSKPLSHNFSGISTLNSNIFVDTLHGQANPKVPPQEREVGLWWRPCAQMGNAWIT